MPQKSKDSILQEWVSAGFRGLMVCVISMGVFVFNNLNKSIESLNISLKSMDEANQKFRAETDKRVSAIEVAREINMAGYQKLLTDVQDMKMQVSQVTIRLQTISDFIAKHFK